MLLLFSRPPEFWGIPAFGFVLVIFVIICVVSGALLVISFSMSNEKISAVNEATSRGTAIKSWLSGFAVSGVVFLIANLILAIPAIFLLFIIQLMAFKGDVRLSTKLFIKLTVT